VPITGLFILSLREIVAAETLAESIASLKDTVKELFVPMS